MILASMALVSACSLDEMPENLEATGDQKTITVALSKDVAQSRIAVDDNTSDENTWNFVWEDGEDVGVWYSGCDALVDFSMATFNANASTFTGTVPNDTQSIRVVSPYDEDNLSVTSGTYSLDISEQDGDLDKLYMISEDMISVDGESVITPNMKHMGGFFALYFKLDEAADGTTYEITEVELSGVPTTMDVDLSGDYDNYDNQNTGGTITATLSDKSFTTNDATVEVRLNTLPFYFASGAEMTFTIAYKAGDAERTTKAVLSNSSDSAIAFSRAKFNYCTITIDPSTVNFSYAEISTWNNGAEDENLEALLPDSN